MDDALRAEVEKLKASKAKKQKEKAQAKKRRKKATVEETPDDVVA